MTGEDVAAQLDALLKHNGGGGVPGVSVDDAWELPRSHTERMVMELDGTAV